MGNKTQKLSNIVDAVLEWQSVFTGDGSTGLTAVSGRGYFIDTTSGTVTVTFPASPKTGDIISISDYAGTFGTNNVTINPNGDKIQNVTDNGTLDTNNDNVTFVYMDSTRGWRQTNRDSTNAVNAAAFVTATGGTETTSGDFKIHTFTGDGCFVVSCAGNAQGSNKVSYVVVAGGGGGGGDGAGGGGAGGYREGKCSSDPYTASPLAAGGLSVSAQTYPITVGAGGSGGPCVSPQVGTQGANSVFSTITSTGGGRGDVGAGGDGGSGAGGGRSSPNAHGSGNTPPVSPPQGNDGAPGGPPNGGDGAAGGGGATATGSSNPGNTGGAGGAGATSCITGSPVARAGGGGGGTTPAPSNPTGGAGGTGGGGTGSGTSASTAGSANTGGGGGGSSGGPVNKTGAAGGKGIVIIRYKYQ